MSSINDVLKEKFGVNGSNIAETLSKITPGEGGGSGWLVVNANRVQGSDPPVWRFDKTAGEIVEALPLVAFRVINNDDEDFYNVEISCQFSYIYLPEPETDDDFIYTFGLDEAHYTCNSASDYPTYVEINE